MKINYDIHNEAGKPLFIPTFGNNISCQCYYTASKNKFTIIAEHLMDAFQGIHQLLHIHVLVDLIFLTWIITTS